MRNPWRELPDQPPFILAMDRSAVDKYNESVPEEAEPVIQLDQLPRAVPQPPGRSSRLTERKSRIQRGE